nr:hypothetical protein GCM10020092_046960 [Actinoplanes digitatis]
MPLMRGAAHLVRRAAPREEGPPMALPDFLIAGVPKAGTTALHAALVRHPGLFLPTVKEPKFFLTDGPPPRTGGPGDVQTYQEHVWRRDDYEALFAPAPAGTLRGEATPFYLYDHGAHDRIHALVPSAKLILLLRDPVDRAHSNWTHLWNAGLEPEADFLTACGAEQRRRADGWADFWHYISLGLYGRQVQHLYKVFPREQVLLLRYRELKDAPSRDARPGLRLPRRTVRGAPGDPEGEREPARRRGQRRQPGGARPAPHRRAVRAPFPGAAAARGARADPHPAAPQARRPPGDHPAGACRAAAALRR